MQVFFGYFFIFSLLTLNGYSQDGIENLFCDFKIVDNQVDCSRFLFSECPQQILQESRYNIVLQIHDGEEKNEIINFKKLENDSSGKSNKDKTVVLFKNDFRAEKIKTMNNLKLNISDLPEYMKVSFQKEGNKVLVPIEVFGTNKFKINLEFPKDEKKPQIVFVDRTQVIVNCEKINQRIFGDLTAEKEAIRRYSEKFLHPQAATPE